ncbi:peptidylprolyl isomerase [Neogemmobacter tilapiae]|uniref:Parvulin-like PPIase n=1 Tax=Neogemmobacter tilapiae TaxID=875041 RepID=A0A918TJM4_9RHOB|nr:peptidylprolyl isomerase [Gemmobacter tilapiae]GHC52088.1 peptidyl-prolyl cis-trans isomerase [Gemmobacter tilapiae]
MKPLLPPVSVNGVTIDPARIAAEAQMHPAPKGKPGLAWRSAAQALALREVLLQKARAVGLTPDPQESAPGQWETEEEALIRQLLEQAVTPEPVDDAALRALYDSEPNRFRAPPLWDVAHILFAAPEEETEARQKARALSGVALASLLDRPALWDQIAREQSACSSRAHGGRLGQVGPGDTVPAFERALRVMDEGQIAGPVETPFGFHLIRLDAFALGDVLPFAVVAPRLRLAAEKSAWVHAVRAYAETLLQSAQVEGVNLKAA